MRRILFACAVSAMSVLGCSSTEPDLAEGQKEEAHIATIKKIPARSWLASNKNDSALATNRFDTTANAAAFVERLFSLGAVEVYVGDPMDEQGRIAREGGPYADTVIVKLPNDPDMRRTLFKLFATEARREGFTPVADVGQEHYLLWWD